MNESNAAPQESNAPPQETTPAAKTVPMVFRVTGWGVTQTLNRAGREAGTKISADGTIVWLAAGGGHRTFKARADIVPKDPKLRLDVVLNEPLAVLTIPLEDFAMQRIEEKMKELISGFGMELQMTFVAEETASRQQLDDVNFNFLKHPPKDEKA